ncbi:hypothetical protein [Nioella nitratireducens]|nr:hypothetical protein [Nioella nitratireducens]
MAFSPRSASALLARDERRRSASPVTLPKLPFSVEDPAPRR